MSTVIPPAPTAPALLGVPLPAGTISPLAVGIPIEFLQRDATELARRIVAQIDTPLQLAHSMGLNDAQWLVLAQHPHFLQVMREAKAEANSAAGLADRVRLKALMVLDQGALLDMAQIINSQAAAPNARVGAFNAIADVAGITKQKDQQASQAGAGPLVVINMPSSSGGPVTIGGRTIDGDSL